MRIPNNLVVKIGTSVLTRNGAFTKAVIDRLSLELIPFLEHGTRVSVVSSGAIGAGMTLLNQNTRPSTMEGLQAFAAIGQRYLMQCWEDAFSKNSNNKYSTAQVLLTRSDMEDPARQVNAIKTLNEIQKLQHVPIINENDTVATEEIKFGDNDQLSAMLAKLIGADRLIILSDKDGLEDSAGNKIPVVEANDSSIFKYVRDKQSPFTVGGMEPKLHAIRSCTNSGISVTLTAGTTANLFQRIERDEGFGTYFKAKDK